MKILLPALCCCLLLTAASCNIINPKEAVPTYVQVDSFSFSKGSVPGTASHKITSVFAYWDNQLVGIFSLPARFPVIMQKAGVLQLAPGIDFNALHGQLVNYPFFNSDTQTVQPAPGTVLYRTPATSYIPGTVVPSNGLQDFEGDVGFTRYSGDTEVLRSNAPGTVLEGAFSGAIYLNAPQTQSVSIMKDGFPLTVGEQAYLELDYRNTMPIQIGLQSFDKSGNVETGYIIGLKPRTDWNKVYISLRDYVGTYQNGPYKVIIQAKLDDGQANGQALIDNLRVITF